MIGLGRLLSANAVFAKLFFFGVPGEERDLPE
jgi:hypothetical protein